MLANANIDLIPKVVWSEFRTYPRKEDLYSAGYDGLLRAEKGFDPTRESGFRSFAYACVKNACVDEIRREERGQEVQGQDWAIENQRSRPEASVEDLDAVNSLLAELPEDIRELVMLRVGYGLTFKEILQKFPNQKRTTLFYRIERAMELMKQRAQQMAG